MRLEGLADQLLTLLPKCFRAARIQCIGAHSFTNCADGHIVRNDFGRGAAPPGSEQRARGGGPAERNVIQLRGLRLDQSNILGAFLVDLDELCNTPIEGR